MFIHYQSGHVRKVKLNVGMRFNVSAWSTFVMAMNTVKMVQTRTEKYAEVRNIM